MINFMSTLLEFLDILWISILGLISFSTFALIFAAFKIKALKNLSTSYDAIQKTHEGSTPRLGGLCVWFVGICASLIFEQTQLLVVLISFIPILVVITWEDLFQNVHVFMRFSVLILTPLFIWFGPIPLQLPVIDLPIIGEWLNNPILAYPFYTLCLALLMNGMNFIDGMNGILAAFSWSILGCCLVLSYSVGEYGMATDLLFIAIPLLLFSLVNYPGGFLFMGDAGAYLMGFVLGWWLIRFFGVYTEISSWSALLILSYPVTEVIYSTLRKLSKGASPFLPDIEHLHIKFYHIFLKSTGRVKTSNNLVVIALAFFWLAPLMLLPLVMHNTNLILLSISLIVALYITLNLALESVD